ncbi:hypothetical protein QM012_003992 [Aureobasidium pullulans]|uniref:DUF642 domain-containing protein n=1 Tax=Aureobasidium pullulans TaxID=5580 RepID=A0ABR0T6D1_AURPU
MKIDNQTPFQLTPNGQYAYWGETNVGPQGVNAYTNDGNAGELQASSVPWVGSAGISGYFIAGPSVWIILLGSDPDWSAEDNRARVAISSTSLNVDKDQYNRVFDGQTKVSLPTTKGVFTLTGSIGSNDSCTATYQLTFQRGGGVTPDILASSSGW